MRRRLVFGLVGLVTVALPSTAIALGPPVGPPVVPPSPSGATMLKTLDAANPIVTFGGGVTNPTPLPLVNPPAPVVCALNCQEFKLTVNTSKPVLFAIKGTVTGPNGTFNADDGFDLYVYGPSGSLLQAGNGVGANGQALTVSNPIPGLYTLVVTFTYAEDPNAAYIGEVRIMADQTWKPPACTETTVSGVTGCFNLPTLIARPAYDLAVSGLPPVASTPLGFPLPVSAPTQNSCYVDESIGLDDPSVASISNPVTRCLRFTSDVIDVGAGAMEVHIPLVAANGGTPSSGFLPGECEAQQVLTSSTGTTVTRPAGACEFHPEHGHFHYKNLLSYGLYNIAPDGGIGSVVSKSQKESFCLSDDDYIGYGTAGPNGPRQFVGQPDCNLPTVVSAAGALVDMGISPGWGDVYTWDTPDQFIDISHLDPGTTGTMYYLVERTNASQSILVAGASQQCSLTKLLLTATSVKSLSTQASVPCPAQ